MDGISVLRELRQRNVQVPILLLTAYATVATAVEATKLGATDYLRKPFDLEDVLMRISRYLYGEDRPETGPVREKMAHAVFKSSEQSEKPSLPGFHTFIGTSSVLKRPLALAKTASETEYPVLICGEEGSGRRYLANLIHENCLSTHENTIVTIDCASLPAPILEQELLDAEAGETAVDDPQPATGVAYTGRWQQALGGTLLLANANALPEILTQRAVSHLSTYLRTPQRPFGLRLILTCQQPLPPSWQPLLQSAITIELPPLRGRLDDLPLLLAHFVPNAPWQSAVKVHFATYDWPGNVAELKQIVQQAYLLARGKPIDASHLPSQLWANGSADIGLKNSGIILPEEGIDLDALEKDLILQALEMSQGNKAHAARLLGLTRATLLYRIEKHELLDS
jgi:DNA-binding NtrC family response regulator